MAELITRASIWVYRQKLEMKVVKSINDLLTMEIRMEIEGSGE